jgi:hypothetical protein
MWECEGTECGRKVGEGGLQIDEDGIHIVLCPEHTNEYRDDTKKAKKVGGEMGKKNTGTDLGDFITIIASDKKVEAKIAKALDKKLNGGTNPKKKEVG